METITGSQSRSQESQWYSSNFQSNLDNRMSVKRPISEDSKYPPKKRALMEHRAQESLSAGYQGNHVASYDGQWKRTECLAAKLKQETAQLYTRPRSDSLHSNFSVISETSDAVSTVSREDSPFPFQTVQDHHTPERNPLKALNSQIAKPLFQNTDSDASLNDEDSENAQPDKENNMKNERQTIGQIKERTRNPDIYIPRLNEVEGDDDKENRIPGDFVNTSGNYGNGTHINQNSHMGPMVSLIHRFNAEAPVSVSERQSRMLDNVQNQSERQLFSQADIAPKTGDYLQAQSKSLSHGMSSLLQAQAGVLQAATHPTGLVISNLQQDTELAETDEQRSETYTCPICSKLIKQRGHYIVHLKSHEGENCKCRICGEMLHSLDKLQQHMKSAHKGDNPYKCEHCSREFGQYNNLRRHLRVHRAKIYKCQLCDREFNEEFYLTMHMGTHTGKRVYSCGVCNACFSSSHDLKIHVKTHSPSKLHTCEVCEKSFSKACVLRQHKKGHSGDRPHKCDKCLKTFIHRHHLTMHMRSHSDSKPYTCDICKKEFYQSSHLYKHLRCHENENDIYAVNAIKDKLDQLNPVKTDKRRARGLRTILPKNTDANTGRSNPLPDSQHAELKNPALDCLPSVDTVLPAVTSEQQSYMATNAHVPPPPPMAPNTSPMVPPVFAMPHLPIHNYHHLYQAYAAQAYAYYDKMYKMNYATQNAMVHPDNAVRQNGHSHRGQASEADMMRDVPASQKNTTVYKLSLKRERQTLESDNEHKPKETVDSVEEKNRAEAAQELLKMSKANVEDSVIQATTIAQSSPQDSYVVDHSRTIDFTKCIGDVIDKTMKVQPKHGLTLPSFSETKSQSIGVETKAKRQSEPTRSTNDRYTLTTPLQHSESSLYPSDHQHSVLNLSQKKVNHNIPQPQYPSQVSRAEGFHGNYALSPSSAWNYPTPTHAFSNRMLPAGGTYTGLTHFYPNQVPSYGVPSPHAAFSYPPQGYNYGTTSAGYQVVGNPKDSPKKRHASYHDVGRFDVALDLRNADTNNRSRHVSENFAGILARSRAETGVHTKDGTRLNSLMDSTEMESTASEVTEAVQSDNNSSKTQEKTVESSNDEIDNYPDEKEVEYDRQRLELFSEFKREIKTVKEFEAETSQRNTGNMSIGDSGEEIVKLDDRHQHRNVFEDSLEEKKLEIDFEEESSVDIEVNMQSKFEINAQKEVIENKETLESYGNEKDSWSDLSDVDTEDKETDKTLDTDQNNVDAEKEEIDGKEKGRDAGVNLEQSVEDHRSEAAMTCGLCWEKFTTTEEVEKHQVVHARELNASNTCAHCDRGFTGPFDLQCHILKHHSDTRVVSQKEEHNKNDAIQQKVTVIVESENEGFECEFCGCKIATLKEFRTHLGTHRGDKPYICGICLRTFAHKHNLNRHKMSHNSKSYECSVCQRTFKESFYLQMHMKVHSEEKTRRCEICDKQVAKSELWEHTGEHLGNIVDNPTYQQIGYRVQEILRSQSTVKGDESLKNVVLLSEQVQKVQQGRGSREELTKLMTLVRGNMDATENMPNPSHSSVKVETKTPLTDLTARHSGNGNGNELVNTFGNQRISNRGENNDTKILECHICQLGFNTKTELSSHVKGHIGSRSKGCKTCGKGFRRKCDLKNHEQTHRDQKPFQFADWQNYS